MYTQRTTLVLLLALCGCRTTHEPTSAGDASSAAPTQASAPAEMPVEIPTPDRAAEERKALEAALAAADVPGYVKTAYGTVTQTPVFVREGVLTPAGEAAMVMVSAAELEAIPPEKINLAALAERRDAGVDAGLELQLARSVGLWILEQWPGNPATFTPEEKELDAKVVLEARAARHLAAVLALGPDAGEQVTKLLVEARPPLAQYTRLIPVLARYRKIVADGGWEVKFARIPRPKRVKDAIRYKPKRRVPGALIPAVKRRLHAEGYYQPKDQEDGWNDDFEAAVAAYRRSHQLWPRVWLDYELRESMQLPAEFRVIQIQLALERMRRSRIGTDDYFIHVVVPDYHAEVWSDGAQQMRFRVVVGGRQRYRDRKTKEWRFPNATPLFSDKMERVVLNPYWTVPARLRKEIRREQEKDPEHYAKHGYVEVPLGGGGATIRQNPGPMNALGRVKFLFPNEHDVYMHDTPRKDLFRSPSRAYSHGCVRVQDPLDLAWFLLSKEEREDLTERRIKRNAFGGGQFRYELTDGPTVHIEYWTVRVEDDGTVQWLDDIYLHDSREARDRFNLDLGNLK